MERVEVSGNLIRLYKLWDDFQSSLMPLTNLYQPFASKAPCVELDVWVAVRGALVAFGLYGAKNRCAGEAEFAGPETDDAVLDRDCKGAAVISLVVRYVDRLHCDENVSAQAEPEILLPLS